MIRNLSFLLILVFIVGCAPVQENLIYTVGGCGEEVTKDLSEPKLDIKFAEDRVSISQKLDYVCCADIKLSYEKEGNVLKIYEENVGEVCKCLCTYDVEATIDESGVEMVEVYGVGFQDSGYELIVSESLSEEIDIEDADKRECVSDKDCVTSGCSGTKCQAKDAPPVFTTCEYKDEYACYQLIDCGCVDGKCEWRKDQEFFECKSEFSA